MALDRELRRSDDDGASKFGMSHRPSTRRIPRPSSGGGYTAQLIATGLKRPRGIIFDSKGACSWYSRVLAFHLTFDDRGGTCLSVAKTTNLIDNNDVCAPLQASVISAAQTDPWNTVAQPRDRAVERWQDPLRLQLEGGFQLGL